jgi:pilus assembly protein CpaF
MTKARAIPQVDERLIEQLCERLRSIPGDPEVVVPQHVTAVAPLLHGPARTALIDATIARLTGLDHLEMLLTDPSITEILVNHHTEIWVERHGALERAGNLPRTALPNILERILAPLGRRLDRTHPIVDARLADGSRLCAVIEPVAVGGTALSIRRFPKRNLGLEHFIGDGEHTEGLGQLLMTLIAFRLNIIISGATSSGKTSLMTALLALLNENERLVLIEDTTEIPLDHAHLVRLETRVATPDGPPPIGLEQLVRTALRLRPDRLLVGEVRGTEAMALIQAMNTGHDGSISTCHANSAHDALIRLETMVLTAAPSWPLEAIRSQLRRSLDVVIHVARCADGSRTITEILAVDADGERPLFSAEVSPTPAGLIPR